MGSQSNAEGGKAKEEALQACAKLHRELPVGRVRHNWTRAAAASTFCAPAAAAAAAADPVCPSPFSPAAVALVTCFKTCSFGSSFTGCCTQEHKAFWECYTQERVRRATWHRCHRRLTSGVSGGGRLSHACIPPLIQTSAVCMQGTNETRISSWLDGIFGGGGGSGSQAQQTQQARQQ